MHVWKHWIWYNWPVFAIAWMPARFTKACLSSWYSVVRCLVQVVLPHLYQPQSLSTHHLMSDQWCSVSSCCQWCCRPSLEKSWAVPNSDSVAVYTEGCVQWSYPADGDRGVGGGGGQIERLRWWRLCRQLIVQTHMYSIQCSISDNVYTYNNGSFGHLLVPRALICPQILINYLLQWFFQAYWH